MKKVRCYNNWFDRHGWNGTEGLERARIDREGTVIKDLVQDGEFVIVTGKDHKIRFKGRLIDQFCDSGPGSDYGSWYNVKALFEVPGGFRVWRNGVVTKVKTREEMIRFGYGELWPHLFPDYIEDLDEPPKPEG